MTSHKNYSMKQTMIASVVAAGLILSPLPGLSSGHAAAAETVKTIAAQTSNKQVYVDGQKLSLNPAPIVSQGTTLVPMRAIFNALGANLTWNQQTKTVTATKGSDSVSIKIGSASAVKNGQTVKLTAAAQEKNGSTLVPLRFVSEAFGAQIAVDASSIRITSGVGSATAASSAGTATSTAVTDSRVKLTSTQIVGRNDSKVVMISTDQAQGSGVIVGGSLILTNYHVIGDAKQASVTLSNGNTVQVKGIVGFSEEDDLAIIQTSKPLTASPVTLANALSIQKGDQVISISSPLGVQNTAASGLVSNVDSEIIQISVPIDHGSSGGALFNEYGELIGITTSKIEDTSAELNFAVPVDRVIALLQQISLNPPATVGFTPSVQADLSQATADEVKQYFVENYGDIATTQGTTTLKNVEVGYDGQGWLTIEAVMDPSFYMRYGNKAADELRYWAINAGSDLRAAIPTNKTIRIVVNYQQDFNFRPRGLEQDEVTDLNNGKYRVRYPVIDMQVGDKMYVSVRT